jgi:TATA-box binding protein (TBP) (component of TFIID and TFIIIB)
MTFSTPIIKIVNVVGSTVLDQKLDLDDLAVKFPDVESHPE